MQDNPDAKPANDNQDRVIVAEATGMLRAVKLNEPNWTGYAAAVQPILDWADAHPPR